MAKKDAYKYSVYNAVSKKLKADGVEGDGVVATILLETFLERKGVLKAAHVYGKKTKGKKGQPGKILIGDEVGISFKDWRKNLENLGWIIYDEEFSNRTRRYSDHQAGPKLIEYLNAERTRISEFATMDDIRRVDTDIQALRDELTELKNAIQLGATKYLAVIPPDTKERRNILDLNFRRTGRFYIDGDPMTDIKNVN
ncbi:MAG: hypothetical protein M3Q07_20955 [Pseudobdellovibrionaceae bacterium]|nr:hypothetical protein [Pseudobdellovibrionaceae bacterium]